MVLNCVIPVKIRCKEKELKTQTKDKQTKDLLSVKDAIEFGNSTGQQMEHLPMRYILKEIFQSLVRKLESVQDVLRVLKRRKRQTCNRSYKAVSRDYGMRKPVAFPNGYTQLKPFLTRLY